MPIVGFNFTKIQAEKKNPLKEDIQLKINSKLGITKVQKEKLPTGKTQADGLRLDFEFSLDYLPNIATISIEGFIYYLDDPGEINRIAKNWEKDKNIPLEIKKQVLNTIILKATIRALSLEQEINVPPHMPFPSVQPAPSTKGKDDYIG